MKKFIISIFAFIPASLAIYLVLICVWGEIMPGLLKPNLNYKLGLYGFMYTRINDVRNYKNIDVLFLGSSHAYRGFDTRIFEDHGLKVFNFGSSDQTPIQTKVILERYLNQLNPKLIVFEVSPIIFTNDGVESSLELIANSKNDIKSIRMALKLANMKSINTLLYGFYRDILKRNSGYIESKTKGIDKYISGGYVEQEIQYYYPENFSKQNIIFNQKQLNAFEDILNLVHSRHIDLVLVQAPVSNSLYESYDNMDEFDMRMNKYGKYIDFNKIMHFNDSIHFYDPDHMNQIGVTYFNNKLIDTLKLSKIQESITMY